MKQLIFKNKKYDGWYIMANNYKDKEDVVFINIFFPKGTDKPIDCDRQWIDIVDAQFSCYKGKVGLTIFKYEYAKAPSKSDKPKKSNEEKALEFAKDNNVQYTEEIATDTDNLPFY